MKVKDYKTFNESRWNLIPLQNPFEYKNDIQGVSQEITSLLPYRGNKLIESKHPLFKKIEYVDFNDLKEYLEEHSISIKKEQKCYFIKRIFTKKGKTNFV